MRTRSETQLLNETVFEQLSTPGMEKEAANAITEFTRNKMREDGIERRVLPQITVTPDDLDRQYDTDMPAIVIDKENDNPPAITVPYGQLPTNVYLWAPRYRVTFDRILSPRFTKDVVELATWDMDIRQVVSDNAVKDMLAEEDVKFFSAVNTALVGLDTVAASGVVQWKTINGGISRNTLEESRKIMPQAPGHLEAVTCVCNNVFVKDVEKFGRDEIGGDMSQDLIEKGWSERQFMNMNWIITIKRDLVADDTIFMFSDPMFIGKNFMLEESTMYIKKEAFMLEFFMYQTAGGTIGNIYGLAKAKFA